MPVEKVHHKAKGEITKYTCDFCRAEFGDQWELREHSRLEHKVAG